jgi:response regulator of citrate/malate metabolism
MDEKSARALIVDDEQDIRETFQQKLETMKIFDRIDLAEDGVQATEAYDKSEYDLIILDNFLPKKKGIDFLRTISGDLKEKKTKVIFISGNFDQSVVNEALDSGCFEIVSKPISLQVLEQKILRLLKKKS